MILHANRKPAPQKARLSGRAVAATLALSLGLALGACAGMPTNTTLYSQKQPVVERTNFTLDVDTAPAGLPISEQQRLNGWFEAMDLRYGDRISIENPSANPAVANAVNELAERYGLMVSETAPTTEGYLEPGQARIVISRSDASVPGCPDWSGPADANYHNATSPNYGCAVNTNLAAMVADPQDLLEGKEGDSETVISTSNKAIGALREAEPSGMRGLLNPNADGAGGGAGGQGGGN